MPSIEVNSHRPIIVVAGVIQHPITNQILITKRTKDQHLAGLWEFPGGKVEHGEDLFHALQRELSEEVSINIQSAYPLKTITHQYANKKICLNFWVVTHFTEEAMAKEGQDLEWVALSDLNDYEFPEANKTILKSLQLPAFWMITHDCKLNDKLNYIESVKQSIIQYDLKQILFRSKNLINKEYFLIYEQLKNMCTEYNCRIIINRDKPNDKVAESWHLTSAQLHQFQKRPFNNILLSASCHTLEDIKQAEKLDIDFILLSAVMMTETHPDALTLGWYQFKKLANQTYLPVYALGGVGREDLAVARYHGAQGIAGISTFKAHT